MSPDSTTVPTTATAPSTGQTSLAGAEAALPAITKLGEVPSIVPGAYTTIEAGAFVAVGEGSFYVANVEGGIANYDAGAGALLGVAARSGDTCTRPEYAFSSLWTISCNSNVLDRVNGSSGAVEASVPLPFSFVADLRATGIAATDNEVWVLSDSAASIAARVDPATNTVAGTVPVPPGTEAIRAGMGAVWTVQPARGTVTRLDPATGEVVATVDAAAQFLAVGADSLWALDGERAVVHRIDPATNTVTADITVNQGGMPMVSFASIEADTNAVWVQMAGLPLAAIDPATNAVTARFDSYDHGGIAIVEREPGSARAPTSGSAASPCRADKPERPVDRSEHRAVGSETELHTAPTVQVGLAAFLLSGPTNRLRSGRHREPRGRGKTDGVDHERQVRNPRVGG